jgi:DNA-binding GntR family transcriptional regulator
MMEALSDRDGPRLAAILRQHVMHKCRVVLDQLRAEAGQARA